MKWDQIHVFLFDTVQVDFKLLAFQIDIFGRSAEYMHSAILPNA